MAMHGIPYLLPGSCRTKANVKGEKEGERTYICEFDPLDSDIDVISSLPSGLRLWTPDPGYPGFVVIDVEVSDEDTQSSSNVEPDPTAVRRWHVRCSYGPWSSLLNSPDGNPLHEPPQAWWQASEEQLPALTDKDGQPILNGVGDPYDPGLTRQNTVRTLCISQNFRSYSQADICQNWKDCVNKTQWKGFAPRTLLIAPISSPKGELYQDGNFVFYRFEFQFLLNPDTHDKVVLNQGIRQYDQDQASNGTDYKGNDTYPLKNIKIGEDDATEAVLLSIPGGQPMFAPVDKDNIPTNTHKLYQEIEFNDLPFANVVIPDGVWA